MVDQTWNEKECFTVIGTCTMFEAITLIIVSKGTTQQSTYKLQIENSHDLEVFLSMNKNGWKTHDVMLRYLEFAQWMGRKRRMCISSRLLSSSSMKKLNI